MPKSRGRKPGKGRSRHAGRYARGNAGVELAMLRPMLMADEAERRGDVRGAVEVVEAHLVGNGTAPFWRPWRIQRLLQLLMLEPVLPPWARARWIVEQARQHLHPQMRSRHLRALEIAVELRGGAHRLPGMDEADAVAKVIDHDWVYRQLTLYEYGGLELFLRSGAAPDLILGSDRIREWARAPMRVLRFEQRSPETLTWCDLSTGERVRVPNLGAAVTLLPDECALGRLVPVGADLMFEGPPLPITEETAAVAAGSPAEWLEAVRQEAAGTTFEPLILHGNLLLTDVPTPISKLALVSYLAHRPRGQLTSEDVVDALLALARDTVSGKLDPRADELDLWPCLAAEFVAPANLQVLPERVRPSDAPVLGVLADRLVGPASEVCRELLTRLQHAA